MQNNQVG